MRTLLAVTGTVLGVVALGVAGLSWNAVSAPHVPAKASVSAPRFDGAALAAQIAPFVRINTQNPPGPGRVLDVSSAAPPPPPPPADGEAPVPAVDPRPAWVAYLVDTWLDPMALPHEMLAGALVVRVKGSGDGPPVVLLSHVDTVPVAEDELATWTHPPFEGVIADGFLWGRGTIDNKASTLLQLSAVRHLQEQGIQPSRDVVLVVTPDEETSGDTAKTLAAEHLADLGNPVAAIDEGSFVLPDFIDGLLVGAVAVAEKTYVSLELTAKSESGHSSMPTGDAALDQLSQALVALSTWETEDGLSQAMQEAMVRLAPHRPWPEQMVMGNPGVFEPVLLGIVQGSPAGNAVTRDTVALTMVSGGVKDNVVPSEARATVNARLLPSTDPDGFLARVKAQIDNPRVEVEIKSWPTVAGVGRWETDTFRSIEAAMGAVYPEAVVVPTLTPGTMDARYFAAAGLDTYRIHPFVMPADERRRLHARDERISLDNLAQGAAYYAVLLQSL